jgi:hypothetical protein
LNLFWTLEFPALRALAHKIVGNLIQKSQYEARDLTQKKYANPTSHMALALLFAHSSSLRVRADVEELNKAVRQSFEASRPGLEISKPS